MNASRLLARLALVIGAAPLASVACGGSVDDSTGSTSSSGGAGGTAGQAGSSGAGQAGSAGQAGAASCQRPLPTSTDGYTLCHSIDECPVKGNGYVCTATEALQGCQGPEPPGCLDDASCGNGQVCQENLGSRYCQPACVSDATCSPQRQCDTASGHCVPRPCDTAKPCPEGAYCTTSGTCELKSCDPAAAGQCVVGFTCSPDTFACVGVSCSTAAECPPDNFVCEAGVCARKKCACDTECGTSGFCLIGVCHETPGRCDGGFVCGRPLILDGSWVAAPIARGGAWG